MESNIFREPFHLYWREGDDTNTFHFFKFKKIKQSETLSDYAQPFSSLFPSSHQFFFLLAAPGHHTPGHARTHQQLASWCWLCIWEAAWCESEGANLVFSLLECTKFSFCFFVWMKKLSHSRLLPFVWGLQLSLCPLSSSSVWTCLHVLLFSSFLSFVVLTLRSPRKGSLWTRETSIFEHTAQQGTNKPPAKNSVCLSQQCVKSERVRWRLPWWRSQALMCRAVRDDPSSSSSSSSLCCCCCCLWIVGALFAKGARPFRSLCSHLVADIDASDDCVCLSIVNNNNIHNHVVFGDSEPQRRHKDCSGEAVVLDLMLVKCGSYFSYCSFGAAVCCGVWFFVLARAIVAAYYVVGM